MVTHPLTLALLFASAFCAGVVNSIAGGGTLLTFPTLLWAGVPAVTARLLNRDGVEMYPLTLAPGVAPGLTNVDVPLANLPTGEFLIEINASDGDAKTFALVAIRITA